MQIPAQRLARQLITRQPFRTPAEVVAWFGAMQAQDYLAALWALGLRTPRATEASIEAAIADGSIIRTHVFRWTWQYVPREDLRWMLDLVGSRLITSGAGRFRGLELDQKTLKRCGELFAKALCGGKQLTRIEMAAVLSQGRIPAVNRRLIHILGHAELDGVICSGGRRGKQPTFALLDERVPKIAVGPRDASLAELATRYFQSRGPATERDFAWWTGLPLREVRSSIGLLGKALDSRLVAGERYWTIGGASEKTGAQAHLLPAFDEYQVAYQDRSDVLDPAKVKKMNAGGGLLNPAVVVEGRIVGSWRRTFEKNGVAIEARLFEPVTPRQRQEVHQAAERYGAFLGIESKLTFRRA